MEQSNLGSKPRKPAVGAADRGHNPLYLKKPEPLPIALLKDPRSRWPGTSIREVSTLAWHPGRPAGNGTGNVLGKGFEETLEKSTTSPFMHETHMGGNGVR